MTDDTPRLTWVSVPEAAQAMGVSERTLWRKIKGGEVAVRKRGGRTLVKIEYETDSVDTDIRTDADTEPNASSLAERKGRKAGFDPVHHVRQQVESEALKLRLRQVQAAHKSLDTDEEERQRRVQERAEKEAARRREEVVARERARLEAEERKRKEQAEAARQRRRREIIQKAKDSAVSRYVGLVEIPEEVRAQGLQEIERALAGVAVEELPQNEVHELAASVWRRVTRPVVQAAEEAKRREEERRRKEAEARQRAWEEEQQRDEARRARIERGKAYAERELRGEGLSWSDEWAIMRAVEGALEREVKGDESQEDLEEIVDGVLDPKLEEIERGREEQERAARKRELIRHGESYALQELRDADLKPLDRLTIPVRVKRALEVELDGTESEGEVEDLVESILDRELGE